MARKLKDLSEIGEHNTLFLYRGIDTLQGIVGQLRLGFLNREIPKIADRDIQRARKESEALSSSFDKEAYKFAEALYSLAFFGDLGKRRPDGSFLAINGKLSDEKKKNSRMIEETIFGFNLGNNPWQLHKYQNLPRGETLDTIIVHDNIDKWIRKNMENLDDFEQIVLERSRVFFPYFRSLDHVNENVQRFFSENGLNLDELIPFMLGTRGFLGLQRQDYPNREAFQMYAPELVSYRLKNSQAPRLSQLIGAERGLFQNVKEVLGDWAAFRVILDSEEAVYRLVDTFAKAHDKGHGIMLGKNYVEVIYIDDRFGPKKKSNGYQDYKLMVRFYPSKQDANSGVNGLIAEIQVTDKMSYYNHEIDRTHPAYRLAREEEREMLLPPTADRSRMNHVRNTTSEKQLEVLNFAYRKLNEIFPQYLIFKDLNKYRKNASR